MPYLELNKCLLVQSPLNPVISNYSNESNRGFQGSPETKREQGQREEVVAGGQCTACIMQDSQWGP